MEDVISLRSREFSWEINPTYPLEPNELFSSSWNNFDCLYNSQIINPPSHDFPAPCNFFQEDFNYFSEVFNCPLLGTDHDFAVPQFSTDNSSYTTSLDFDTQPHLSFSSEHLVTPIAITEDKDMGVMITGSDHVLHNLESWKAEPVQSPVFNVGACPEKKRTRAGNKLEGQPSKNLMAERRRRKKLNDRLSMLRSIVPKISKMDRTSILGDTIDYMKELLVRINNLQQEIDPVRSDRLDILSIITEAKASDQQIMVRSSPKFAVERRDADTRVEICCAEKPGLLLSTLTTIEALSLEIQHCVISCFNDFSMQASCSEELEQTTLITSEDIKQALFRSAGYQGRCL